MDWEILVKEFGAKIGLEGCHLESAGLCTITLNEKISLELELASTNDHLMVYVPLHLTPDGSIPNTALELLKFHFDYRAVAQASVTYDQHREEFILCRAMGDEIKDVEHFDVTLQAIVSMAEKWNEHSQALKHQPLKRGASAENFHSIHMKRV